MNIADYIAEIPDYPKPGVLFRDITTLLADAEAFRAAIDQMAARTADLDFDVIIGSESRGFIFGTPLAYVLGKPFALVRKKGKLPRETVEAEYELMKLYLLSFGCELNEHKADKPRFMRVGREDAE